MKATCIELENNNDNVVTPKKPVELVKFLNDCQRTEDVTFEQTRKLKHLELVSRNYGEYDLIFGYATARHNHPHAILFLGHWNDGVFEN
jgi:hypothetical protein